MNEGQKNMSEKDIRPTKSAEFTEDATFNFDDYNDEIRSIFPDGYAYNVSGNAWVPWDYLQLISEEVFREVLKQRKPDEDGGRIIIEAPPRHGKSLFLARYLPLWYLDSFPGKKVILAAHTRDLAASHGEWIRNQIRDSPNVKTKLARDSFSKSEFKTTSGGEIYCVGATGAPTGRGGDLLLIDDPYRKWDDAQNPRIREKVWTWYNNDFASRAEPGATIVVLHTRWHEEDLAGKLQKEEPGVWKVLSFPALSEGAERDLLRREKGVALCPSRFDESWLKRRRGRLSRLQWGAQYQQRPIPQEGVLWKPTYFGAWTEEKKPSAMSLDETAISLDATFKGAEAKKSDYVVMQVWGRQGPLRYFLNQVRGKFDFTQTITHLRALCKEYPEVKRVLIEAKANGPAIENVLKKEIPGIVLIEPKGSKETRAIACLPALERGEVRIPMDTERHPWVNDFLGEAARFPTAPDDQVDAASQILNFWESDVEELPLSTRLKNMTRLPGILNGLMT